MKRKELKNLAKKIAKAEYTIQNTTDLKAKARAEAEIMELSGKVSSIEEMTIIDELVQDLLADMN